MTVGSGTHYPMPKITQFGILPFGGMWEYNEPFGLWSRCHPGPTSVTHAVASFPEPLEHGLAKIGGRFANRDPRCAKGCHLLLGRAFTARDDCARGPEGPSVRR